MTSLARTSDPVTSHLAALSVSSKKITDQHVVLAALRTYGPMTDEELLAHLVGISPSGARTRRAELVRLRLVQDSGRRGHTGSGRQAIIWAAS